MEFDFHRILAVACAADRCRWATENGSATPPIRTSTTCSNCWSLATAAWGRRRFCSVTPTIRLRRRSWARLELISRWKLSSGRTNESSYKSGFVLILMPLELPNRWIGFVQRNRIVIVLETLRRDFMRWGGKWTICRCWFYFRQFAWWIVSALYICPCVDKEWL